MVPIDALITGNARSDRLYRPAAMVEHAQQAQCETLYQIVMKCSQEFRWYKNFNIFRLRSSSVLLQRFKRDAK